MAALSGETAADRPEAILIDGKPAGTAGARRAARARCLFRAGRTPRPRRGQGHDAERERAALRPIAPRGLVRGGLVDMGGTIRFAAEIIQGLRRAQRPDRKPRRARSPAATCSASSSAAKSCSTRASWSWRSRPGVSMPAPPLRSAKPLLDLADKGAAVVMISQDLDELMEMADRIAVIAHGRLSPPRKVAEVRRDDRGDRSADGRRRRQLRRKRGAMPFRRRGRAASIRCSGPGLAGPGDRGDPDRLHRRSSPPWASRPGDALYTFVARTRLQPQRPRRARRQGGAAGADRRRPVRSAFAPMSGTSAPKGSYILGAIVGGGVGLWAGDDTGFLDPAG